MLGLPVEMLTDGGGTSLADRYRVSYAPSSTVYAWMVGSLEGRQSDSSPRALLVGDPPHSEAQLASIQSEHVGDQTGRTNGAARDASAAVRSALAGDRQAMYTLPRLAGTRGEVLRASEACPGATVLLGAAATEEELVRLSASGELGSFDVLHIATHALVDNSQPESSALVMSQVGLPDPFEAVLSGERIYDGLITAEEVARTWELSADLVVLSACDTGLGKEISGEGYVGFAHAFLQAGARSLLLSMWKVDDTATSMLMGRFYENWLGHADDYAGDGVAAADASDGARDAAADGPVTKMTKAEALRQAKLWLRDYRDESGNRPYRHPYFWSGFVLIGDPT
jgi:CHAT domain-containing protein